MKRHPHIKEGKLRILAAGDLHGSADIAKKLAEKAKREKVDLVILAGDLHGYTENSADIIAPFKRNHQKVVFVPGNLDTTNEIDLVRAKHNIKNIDGYYVNYHGVDIIGVGNPDFELSLDEKETLKKLSKNFNRIKSKKGKTVLVSHLHAHGTKAEFSGIPGEVGLRKAIDKFQPDFFISAHIHEAEGIEEKIGKTRVIQVGREGKVIEI